MPLVKTIQNSLSHVFLVALIVGLVFPAQTAKIQCKVVKVLFSHS